MKWAADAGFGWSRNARVKLARHVLLHYPVLGMSIALTMAAPCGASTRQAGAGVPAYSGLTHQQSRLVHRYERYLARIAEQRRNASRVVRFAYRQIGKPYRWGGAGPNSYDCSGLAMTAWRRGGLSLPHRADLQYRVIPRKVPIRRLRPGDLVFFSGAGHVGIYVGHGRFIHAPHTGTVVQRGTLTGWRRRAFFGAARPGVPAYRSWPRWVRRLVGRSPADGGAGPVRAPSASVSVADPEAFAEPGGPSPSDLSGAEPSFVPPSLLNPPFVMPPSVSRPSVAPPDGARSGWSVPVVPGGGSASLVRGGDSASVVPDGGSHGESFEPF